QPDGPIRLTKRPAGIDSVTGASAWNAPAGVLNVMVTSSTQSFGGGGGMHPPADRAESRWFPSPPGLYRKPRASGHGRRVVPGTGRPRAHGPVDDGKLSRLHKVSAAPTLRGNS